MSSPPKNIRHVVIASIMFLTLNYAWELSHSRLFTNYEKASRIHHALACLQHAFTDLLIGSGAYFVIALAFGSPCWASEPHWRWAAIAWLGLGLMVTVGIEVWATSIGRWEYTEAMPTVFGIGLTPLLQWLIVPTVVLLLFRRLLPSA